MSTIAIVGAGPGLGAAIARRFGREGFAIALLARNRSRLDDLVTALDGDGLVVRGYAADVREPASLKDALERAGAELGPIGVLAYSPLPQKEFLRPVLETSVDDLAAAVEFSIYGPVTAVQHVLHGLRDLGGGSILFANGGSAARPNANVAGTSIAFAGESAYARMLHDALAAEHIQVGQLIIPGVITKGHPTHDPDVLADKLWYLHTHPEDFRLYAEELPGALEPVGT